MPLHLMYSTPNDKHKASGHYESLTEEMDGQRNHYRQYYNTERRSRDNKVTGVGVYDISASDKLCDADHLAGRRNTTSSPPQKEDLEETRQTM